MAVPEPRGFRFLPLRAANTTQGRIPLKCHIREGYKSYTARFFSTWDSKNSHRMVP